jgi:response regulator RpfG family c-di-GMP phosphodiesterase
LDAVLNKHIRDKRTQKLVFVVDDNDEDLNAAAAVLEADYDVMTMLSMDKMFSLLGKKRPDIILIEKEMEGTIGSDTIERLNECPEWKDIPIVFLEKPFELSSLPYIVKKHIT